MVKVKSTGTVGKITDKTVNRINCEWETVWFIDVDYSKSYTSYQFDLVE